MTAVSEGGIHDEVPWFRSEKIQNFSRKDRLMRDPIGHEKFLAFCPWQHADS